MVYIQIPIQIVCTVPYMYIEKGIGTYILAA